MTCWAPTPCFSLSFVLLASSFPSILLYHAVAFCRLERDWGSLQLLDLRWVMCRGVEMSIGSGEKWWEGGEHEKTRKRGCTPHPSRWLDWRECRSYLSFSARITPKPRICLLISAANPVHHRVFWSPVPKDPIGSAPPSCRWGRSSLGCPRERLELWPADADQIWGGVMVHSP